MLTNPNTMLAENRTIMTANDVVWKESGENLELQSVAGFHASLGLGATTLFTGDVMRWTFEKSTNNYCDAGFRVNISQLQQIYQGLVGRTLKGKFTAYVFQGDAPWEQSFLGKYIQPDPGFYQNVTFE
jgi:hypothetical protein